MVITSIPSDRIKIVVPSRSIISGCAGATDCRVESKSSRNILTLSSTSQTGRLATTLLQLSPSLLFVRTQQNLAGNCP